MTSSRHASRGQGSAKSSNAFRTISEVSDELQIPQHVLRFWETKFNEVQPLKRGGGRRYYRPEDISLLRRIRDLLYTEGYTIKGVQKLLREGQIMQPVPGEMPPLAAPESPNSAALAEATPELRGERSHALDEERKATLEAVLEDLLAVRDRLRDLS